VSGFLGVLEAAVRKRGAERPGMPFQELEEMAERASTTRRDFTAALRRDAGSGPDSGQGALRLVPLLAGADPGLDATFAPPDPGRFGAAGREAEATALAVCTEPDLYRGVAEWVAIVRGESELPVLRLDWFLTPRAVIEALTFAVDAILLDPRFLGRDSLNEALGIARHYGASGVVPVRSIAEAERALEENPPAILLDRRDPETFAVRPRLVDRILEVLEPYPGVRIVTGGLRDEAGVRAAARRRIDAVLLDPEVAAEADVQGVLKRLVEAAAGPASD
jgi:indole-3-glycerol phosphate synthase